MHVNTLHCWLIATERSRPPGDGEQHMVPGVPVALLFGFVAGATS